MARKLNHLAEDFMIGAQLLNDEDTMFLLDKIEQARWETGPTYNRGVHMLLDVVQSVVERRYQHKE